MSSLLPILCIIAMAVCGFVIAKPILFLRLSTDRSAIVPHLRYIRSRIAAETFIKHEKHTPYAWMPDDAECIVLVGESFSITYGVKATRDSAGRRHLYESVRFESEDEYLKNFSLTRGTSGVMTFQWLGEARQTFTDQHELRYSIAAKLLGDIWDIYEHQKRLQASCG